MKQTTILDFLQRAQNDTKKRKHSPPPQKRKKTKYSNESAVTLDGSVEDCVDKNVRFEHYRIVHRGLPDSIQTKPNGSGKSVNGQSEHGIQTCMDEPSQTSNGVKNSASVNASFKTKHMPGNHLEDKVDAKQKAPDQLIEKPEEKHTKTTTVKTTTETTTVKTTTMPPVKRTETTTVKTTKQTPRVKNTETTTVKTTTMPPVNNNRSIYNSNDKQTPPHANGGTELLGTDLVEATTSIEDNLSVKYEDLDQASDLMEDLLGESLIDCDAMLSTPKNKKSSNFDVNSFETPLRSTRLQTPTRTSSLRTPMTGDREIDSLLSGGSDSTTSRLQAFIESKKQRDKQREHNANQRKEIEIDNPLTVTQLSNTGGSSDRRGGSSVLRNREYLSWAHRFLHGNGFERCRFHNFIREKYSDKYSYRIILYILNESFHPSVDPLEFDFTSPAKKQRKKRKEIDLFEEIEKLGQKEIIPQEKKQSEERDGLIYSCLIIVQEYLDYILKETVTKCPKNAIIPQIQMKKILGLVCEGMQDRDIFKHVSSIIPHLLHSLCNIMKIMKMDVCGTVMDEFPFHEPFSYNELYPKLSVLFSCLQTPSMVSIRQELARKYLEWLLPSLKGNAINEADDETIKSLEGFFCLDGVVKQHAACERRCNIIYWILYFIEHGFLASYTKKKLSPWLYDCLLNYSISFVKTYSSYDFNECFQRVLEYMKYYEEFYFQKDKEAKTSIQTKLSST